MEKLSVQFIVHSNDVDKSIFESYIKLNPPVSACGFTFAHEWLEEEDYELVYCTETHFNKSTMEKFIVEMLERFRSVFPMRIGFYIL